MTTMIETEPITVEDFTSVWIEVLEKKITINAQYDLNIRFIEVINDKYEVSLIDKNYYTYHYSPFGSSGGFGSPSAFSSSKPFGYDGIKQFNTIEEVNEEITRIKMEINESIQKRLLMRKRPFYKNDISLHFD